MLCASPALAFRKPLALASAFLLLLSAPVFAALPDLPNTHHRQILVLSEGWRFHLGDSAGAQEGSFKDASWSVIDLPHDWSIGSPRSPDAPTGMGGGYVEAGLGWYRKTFIAPKTAKAQAVRLRFDGVYGVTEVWLNGRPLGNHVYGYTSFTFDVTAELRHDGPNVLAVRVDNSVQPNSRWYSGSGIYRSVVLECVDPVHIAPNGVFVRTTDVSEKRAVLQVLTTVRNTSDALRKVSIHTLALTPGGNPSEPVISTYVLEPKSAHTSEQSFSIEAPELWSLESPKLYTLVSRVLSETKSIDLVETNFGLRTIRVSPESGFELNGKPIKLNGANLHHDHGALGARSFPAAELRRVKLLKAAGYNAVRTAHNPPDPAFLDACDRLGLLVMDEPFDCWELGKNSGDYSRHFNEWWQRDLDAMVLRDRNHPSIVMWSIGNEVNERGTAAGVPIALRLAERVRKLDPTRLVSCGWNFPWGKAKWEDMDPMYAALDVAGYNYEHKRHADDHKRVPARVILATESFQSDTFAIWAIAQDFPYFMGDFVWSGMDYLGESGIGRAYPPGEKLYQHWQTQHWPWYGATCGDIDITGWRKPISHYRNIVWDRGEKLYMAVIEPTADGRPWQPTLWAMPPALESWTWPGQEGKSLTVEVYSRHERVKLYLNDTLVGEKATSRAEQFKAVFSVPYVAGGLKAVGLSAGRESETFTLETAGQPVAVRLITDAFSGALEQGQPSFFVAEIIDAKGRVVPTADMLIEFSADQGAKIIAVATGNLTTPEPYAVQKRRAWHGRVQVIVLPARASDGRPVPFTLSAMAPALSETASTINLSASK